MRGHAQRRRSLGVGRSPPEPLREGTAERQDSFSLIPDALPGRPPPPASRPHRPAYPASQRVVLRRVLPRRQHLFVSSTNPKIREFDSGFHAPPALLCARLADIIVPQTSGFHLRHLVGAAERIQCSEDLHLQRVHRQGDGLLQMQAGVVCDS